MLNLSLALSPEEWQALQLSARVGVAATLGCLPVGLLTAWVLARTRFPGRFWLEALVQLPMVVPPVVPGLALLWAFAGDRPLALWLATHGLSVAFTWKGAALASAVMAFPLMVQPARLAFEGIDPRLGEVASTLGAGPARVFATVTLPLAAPGILVGVMLCFTRSLGEFGATMAFVGNIPGETQTLPLAIYSFSHLPDGDAMVLRLCLLSIVLAVLALAVSHWLQGRSAARRGSRWRP